VLNAETALEVQVSQRNIREEICELREGRDSLLDERKHILTTLKKVRVSCVYIRRGKNFVVKGIFFHSS